MAAANLVLISLAPNLTGESKEGVKKQYEEQIDSKTIQELESQGNDKLGKLEQLSPERERLLFEKVDLTGIEHWSLDEQKQVRENMVNCLH